MKPTSSDGLCEGVLWFRWTLDGVSTLDSFEGSQGSVHGRLGEITLPIDLSTASTIDRADPRQGLIASFQTNDAGISVILLGLILAGFGILLRRR